jgi:hypothetical protein
MNSADFSMRICSTWFDNLCFQRAVSEKEAYHETCGLLVSAKSAERLVCCPLTLVNDII